MRKNTFEATALSKTAAILNMILGFTCGALILFALSSMINDPFGEFNMAFFLSFIAFFFVSISLTVKGLQIFKKKKGAIDASLFFSILLTPVMIAFGSSSFHRSTFKLGLLFALPFFILIVIDALVLKKINQ